MKRSTAYFLRNLCRAIFLFGSAGLVWLLWVMQQAQSKEDLPFASLLEAVYIIILLMSLIGFAVFLGLFLSLLQGVDVFGLNRLSQLPEGKPFKGLEPEEEGRLWLDFTHGAIGRNVYRGIFKLLLTNRRLLVGANLTSWYLQEILLTDITAAEVRGSGRQPWVLRLTLRTPDTRPWEIALSRPWAQEQLLKELHRLGVEVTGSG
jgi:hypothetical protein